jgi:hypothetical protein
MIDKYRRCHGNEIFPEQGILFPDQGRTSTTKSALSEFYGIKPLDFFSDDDMVTF